MRADSTGAMNCIVWRRNPVSIATWGAAAIGFALVLSGSSFVYATRVAPGKRSQLASPETAGSFGEVIRGPHGKSEIALTFDGGAEAECFEDLIAAPRARTKQHFLHHGKIYVTDLGPVMMTTACGNYDSPSLHRSSAPAMW